jgi:hypothetical protein
MIDEIVKSKQAIPEPPEKKLTIDPWQIFKIEIVLPDKIVRDEFEGMGQESFDETLEFAKKICRMYPKSTLHVILRTKHQ